MQMLPFPNIRGLDIFPGMESHTMEFKLSLSNSIKNKCFPTVCAFLNGKGGYIVFGVQDKDRRIVGLPNTIEELNEELLWFDNFYHCKRIRDVSGQPLDPGVLMAHIIEVDSERRVLVATIRPIAGKKYRCHDGSEWHRLAASIYKIKEQSCNEELLTLKERLRVEKRRADLALKDLDEMKYAMRSLIGVSKSIQDELDLYSKEKLATTDSTKICLESSLLCWITTCIITGLCQS
jgi:predicted HTH transcriptional regulator